MWRRIVYPVLGIGSLLCLAPLFGILWSSWFAERHGCTLHEGFVNPCVVNGTDHGPTLYSAFVSGWFLMLTGPIALVLLGILIALVLLDWLNRRKRRRTPPPDA